MSTITTPAPLLIRDETRRQVAHPLERLRGYIRTGEGAVIPVSIVLLVIVVLLSLEWLTRKLLRLA